MTVGGHVRTVDLGVRIGAVTVLDGVNINFEPGRLSAVIGPSGSGKTTLFNVLARLQAPTIGRVDMDGVALGSSQVRIGLVHQAFALLSLLTVAENVELAAQIQRMPRARVVSAAAACLDAVGMTARVGHLVEELSGGEQQRVAIARAMITEPQLLLADEPTAQLDPANRQNVVELLRRIADDGATVIIATHDLEVAEQCDTVVALRSGRVSDSPATMAPTAAGRHRRG